MNEHMIWCKTFDDLSISSQTMFPRCPMQIEVSVVVLLKLSSNSYIILDFANKYNKSHFPMSKLKSRSCTQATRYAQSTIDTILTQGANRLYDNYIKTKIPHNLKNTLQKVIENVFHPYTQNNCNIDKDIKHIHQRIADKINVVDKKRKSASYLDVQAQSFCLSNRNTIQIDSKLGKRMPNKEISKKKCHERKREQPKTAQGCVPTSSQNSGWFQGDADLQQKWAERQKRFDQQLQREEHQRQANQKSWRLKKHLQEQLQQLQANNKTITFNHHTGRIFHLQQHHQYDNQSTKLQKNIIHLKFDFSDQQDTFGDKTNDTKHSNIRNSRKITSFDRKRRKINFIDEDADDANYNNNGKRQTSSLPFMEIQEGVSVLQGKNVQLMNRESTSTKSRINSASMTQRNFKSYTREKMESSRCVKTMATVTSAAKTRYPNRVDKQENKIASGARESILWLHKGESKHHKINKNPQLMGNYFSLTEQC